MAGRGGLTGARPDARPIAGACRIRPPDENTRVAERAIAGGDETDQRLDDPVPPRRAGDSIPAAG